MPTGRRILLLLQATAGTDVLKVGEEIEGFVIFKKKLKESKSFPPGILEQLDSGAV